MWITHVPYDVADERLKQLYDRVKGPGNNVDNIMLAHSLRPHTMEGHMALYKNVLHHAANQLPKWFLEALGIYASRLNGCAYCVDHHTAGLQRLLHNDARAVAISAALEHGSFDSVFDAAQISALHYTRTLTLAAHDQSLLLKNVLSMRAAGLDDGCVLEINQVVAYFNYANRTVLGLGVTTTGDVLGLSPNSAADPADWSHR